MTSSIAPIVVRGRPSAVELAALTGVLAALASGGSDTEDDAAPAPQGWRSRRRQLRIPPSPGPGAWRASSRL